MSEFESNPCHLLLIEDEWLVSQAMELVLHDAGATTVDWAVTEREAVALAERQRPDVVVSDIQLGKGLGTTAVSRICRRWGDIPHIFVTGSPHMAEGCAAVAIVTKPFIACDLARAFRSAMAIARAGSG